MSMPTGLGPEQRARDLQRMKSERFDVVVIGAGITGAGTALDAATRGLSVAIVEQRDYASGTSSRSSKLFHGGLRYLEQFNFKLVMEALHERNLMLNLLCPHLASPIRFLYPLQQPVWERAYVGSGVAIYDVLAALGNNPLPRHRHLSRSKALRVAPALRKDTLVGAIVYSDALVDDARHTESAGLESGRNSPRPDSLFALGADALGPPATSAELTTTPPAQV